MVPIQCPLVFLLFNITLLAIVAGETIKVGVILDANTEAGLSLKSAVQQVNDTSLNVSIHEFGGSYENVIQVLGTEVVAILVQSHMISMFLAPIAESVKVPILSLSREDGFGAGSRSVYLVSVVPSQWDSDEMKAAAAMVYYFRWQEVIVIYEDDDFWLTGVYALEKELQQVGVRISQTAAVHSLSEGKEIEDMLRQLNSSYVRAFIVITGVDVGLKVFSMADELGMMEEPYAWVISDSTASSLDSLNSSSIRTMQGILGIRKNSSGDDMNEIGKQAYTSLGLVEQAVATLVSADKKALEFLVNETPDNTTDFMATMKVLKGGDLLLKEINRLKSMGMAENTGYEIINLAGRSYRTVGFWTKGKGLESPTTELNKLSSVIWPGDTAEVPNGYRKLVIGIVMGNVSDLRDLRGIVSGYTRDIFEAAVKALPYNLPFLYQDFGRGNSPFPLYDSVLPELVNEKEIDVVVGDSTILWNRSLLVDFTQPYTQTSLVMMVPLRKVRGCEWSFLYPFTASLWAIAGAFFLLTAFLVWLTEHHNNEEFSGGITQQIITSLTLSLSLFVFVQREEVRTCVGKGIIRIWLFMALILNNSYTAHLASILTVEKLLPTLANMDSLTTSGVQIGYMNNSFVSNYIIDEFNITPERLIPLGNNLSDYVQNLKSKKVGAIVLESPYVEIIRAQYPCEKFAVINEGYANTGGWVFFVRKGSPFLRDISSAILKISEHHNTINNISSEWFGQGRSCPSLETGMESNTKSITPANLWLLFVLTSSIYAITALVHIGSKLKQRWGG